VFLLGAEADGIKTDLAHHLLINDEGSGRVYVRSAAAVFLSEANAKAREFAYESLLRTCADPMGNVMKSWAMPPDEARAVTVERRRLRLPVGGFAIQRITRFGAATNFSHSTDVILRRKTMIGGLSIHFYSDREPPVDIAALSEVLADRLERAAPGARAGKAIPVFHNGPGAARAARRALMRLSDFPARWRDHAVAEYGHDSGTSVSPGSWNIHLDGLWPPIPGMLGRAAEPSLHVGWSHYISNYAAVYRSERQAKQEASRAFEATLGRANQRQRRRRAGDIEYRDIEPPPFDKDVYVASRIKRWHTAGSKNHPAMDITSTDTLAVVRRGRMVVTYACAAKGEDVRTAHRLIAKVVRRVERAAESIKR
jgi:hypothetical protein